MSTAALPKPDQLDLEDIIRMLIALAVTSLGVLLFFLLTAWLTKMSTS